MGKGHFLLARTGMFASLVLAIELFNAEGMVYFAIVCAVTYVFTGYGGLYHSQKHNTDKWFHTYLGKTE